MLLKINHYVTHMVPVKLRNYYTCLANSKHQMVTAIIVQKSRGDGELKTLALVIGLDRESEVFFSKSN